MTTMIAIWTLMVTTGADTPPTLRIAKPSFELPSTIEFVLTAAGKPGPVQKDYQPLVRLANIRENVVVAQPGPFDLWWIPKVGVAVRVIGNVPATSFEKPIPLDRSLGAVRVRGDNLPRIDKLVLTPLRDPGPGEKGHQPIQFVNDFRDDLVVPEGEYELWLVPSNGARPQRIDDKLRVQAGKVTTRD